mgnify:CR=1 FL=1|tara:strand:+ start:8584 stop:9132 length:549 start_codon:yes stop_codon:yes gene_type:complete
MEITKSFTETKMLKKAIIILAGSAFLTLSAKIQTPLTPVPATMQTFAVLFLGMAIGPKLAVASVVVYLFEGLVGLPVFAKGGGIIYFTGPTSGYLFGFLLGAFFSGYVKSRFDPIITFAYLLFSVSFIYIFGLIWLWSFKGFTTSFNEIFVLGAKPFLIIELYKLLILSVLSKQIFLLRKFI